MSDDAKLKLQRDLDAKTKAYERDIQDANEDLDQELSKVMNDLGAKMVNVIIAQYAAQNGYSVVFDVSNQQGGVLWAAPPPTSPPTSSSYTTRPIRRTRRSGPLRRRRLYRHRRSRSSFRQASKPRGPVL